jgi:tetratricopeptide (TPR) repeat protein
MARLDRTLAQLLVDPHVRATEDVQQEFAAALEAFERLGDERGLAETSLAMVEVDWIRCAFDVAVERTERAAQHARVIGDRRLLQRALLRMQAAQMFGSTKPEDALSAIDAMLAEVGNEGELGPISLVHQSIYASYQGDFDRARTLSDESLALVERVGNRFMIAASCGFRGAIETLAGEPSQAERFARREQEILLALGDDGHRSTSAAELAIVLSDLGRLDEAESLAIEAMSLAAEDDLASQVFGRVALAHVRTARGRYEDAVALTQEGVEMIAHAQMPNQSGQTWFALAQALHAAGSDAEATEAARTALAFFERKGIRPAADSVQAFVAEIGG